MRKSASVCISFIASLMFTHYFGALLGFAVCLLLVLGVLVFLILKKSIAFLSFIAIAFLIGNILMGLVDARFEKLRAQYDNVQFSANVKIVEVLENSRAYVKVKTLAGINQGAYFNVLCKFEPGTLLQKGDIIETTLQMSEIVDTSDFPTRLYNEGKGTVLQATATNSKLISSSALWSFHAKLVSYIESAFDKYLGEFSDFSKSLLLGGMSSLPDEYGDIFASLGIIHIISVSGMHFAILIGLFTALLGAFRLPKTHTCIIVALFAFFYMFITAFSVSVVRSGIMTYFVIFDFILQRRPDKLTTLSLAGALMCLADPTAAVNLSFQLSFLSTFGLIAASYAISVSLKLETDEKPLGKTVRSVLSSVVFSLCSIFFCLAPIASSFKSISLLSPASNLICTPFAEFMLILSFLILPLCLLPHLAYIFGFFYQGVGKIFMFLCSVLNNERFTLALKGSTIIYVSAFLTAFCAILFLIPFKKKKEALLVFITGSVLLSIINL